MTTTSRTAKDIFVELVGNVSPDCWDERLVSVCAGDTELCHRVRALLRAHADPGSLLEQPVIAVAAAGDDQPIAERPGTVIGPYKLLEQIGEGGMGIVFMATTPPPAPRPQLTKASRGW